MLSNLKHGSFWLIIGMTTKDKNDLWNELLSMQNTIKEYYVGIMIIVKVTDYVPILDIWKP